MFSEIFFPSNPLGVYFVTDSLDLTVTASNPCDHSNMAWLL